MKKYKSQPRNQFPRRGVVSTAYCNCNAHSSQTIAKLTRPASKKCTDKGGITLISLVVTIIILLILAGVTLALISGSDGILGKASHALDENKIAMAKEQVELALSDFQTEFYEGKYVERTEDGTKKGYISQKLQAGVETTNFYAEASAEGNVTVYEGKDNSGTEVVKGAIQDDASIKWDDVASGSSGENENISDGTEGNLNLKDLTQLQKTIAQLQEEVNGLKNQLKETNDELETNKMLLEDSKKELTNTKNTLDSILTSQTRQDVLYEGEAKAEGIYNFTFPEGKSLENYKMLYFYTDAYYSNSSLGVAVWCGEQITMVEPKVEDTDWRYFVGYAGTFEIWFSINSSKSFQIDQITNKGNYNPTRIYKVVGIY